MKLKGTVLVIVFLFLLVILGVIAGYLYLPVYLEKSVIPRIGQKSGIKNLRCKIHHLDILNTDIRNLRFGSKNKPGLRIDSIRIDYSLLSLARRHINKVVLDGVNLSCKVKNGKIVVDGFNLAGLKPAEKSGTGKLPVTIGLLEINNGEIDVDWNDKTYKIPFTAKIVSLKSDYSAIGSFLNLKIRNSDIELKDNNISVEGINLDLKLSNLLKFKSAPGQILTFKKAHFGDLTINEGKTIFQIESPRSILIEKGVYEWCKGRVYLHSMRINPQKTKYTILLFGDRVNLSEVLNQFGIAKAEGDGTVSGLIKFNIVNKKIFIEDSALFSSPDKGGVIKLTGTEALTAGIPRGSEQYRQLEFARQALNDFKYDWVKLNLASKGENCKIKLSLLGKPAKPLSINRKTGNIEFQAKIDGKKAVVRPMRLDLNFKIPLNKILHYHAGIKKFLDKI